MGDGRSTHSSVTNCPSPHWPAEHGQHSQQGFSGQKPPQPALACAAGQLRNAAGRAAGGLGGLAGISRAAGELCRCAPVAWGPGMACMHAWLPRPLPTAGCKGLLLLLFSSTQRPCLLCMPCSIPCSPAPALFQPQLTAEPSTSTPRQCPSPAATCTAGAQGKQQQGGTNIERTTTRCELTWQQSEPAALLVCAAAAAMQCPKPCPTEQPVPRTHRPKPDAPPAVKVGVHQPGRCIARLQRFTLRVRVGSSQRS